MTRERDRRAERQDAQRLGPKDESPAPKAFAGTEASMSDTNTELSEKARELLARELANSPTLYPDPGRCVLVGCHVTSRDALRAIEAALLRTRPYAASVGDAARNLRDNAAWLVDRASHKGDYAAIPQDHIDGLRDAVRDFDRATPPKPNLYARKVAQDALDAWDACPDNRAHTFSEVQSVVAALRGFLAANDAHLPIEQAARIAEDAAADFRKGSPMSALHRGAVMAAEGIAEAIRAAAPQLPAVQDAGWQPIETAPKDGTSVLLYHQGDHAVARWVERHWMSEPDPDAVIVVEPASTGAWVVHDSGNGRAIVVVAATHWMPLPAAPRSAQQDAGPAIPAGMVPYGPEHPDYPEQPKDWDGGPYLCRDGKMYHMRGYGWEHGTNCTNPTADWDRIAYTPRSAQ